MVTRRRMMVSNGASHETPVYELQTPMTFDGSTGVDTGFTMSGDYNSANAPSYTILWEGTLTNRNGDKYYFGLRCNALNKNAIQFSSYNNSGAYHSWFAAATTTANQGWANGDLIRVAFRTAPGEGAVYNWNRNSGTQKSKVFSTTPSGAVLTNETVKVGTSASFSTSGRFVGTVSLFRIYNRKFTDQEISDFLANGIV